MNKKPVPKAIQGSGYERGFWLLVGFSGFMIILLLVMELRRGKPLNFGCLETGSALIRLAARV
jgi:hypothetical protein